MVDLLGSILSRWEPAQVPSKRGHSRDPARIKPTGEMTWGGYSQFINVKADFVLRIAPSLPLAQATPLLCAGITVYTPLKISLMKKPGSRVAIAGIGGLGHLALKMATAMGASQVTAITTSDWKVTDLRNKGIPTINSINYHEMKDHRAKFDLIINTIPHPHCLDPYLDLLANHGKLWVLGVLQPFTNHGLELTQKPYTPDFDAAFDGAKIIYAALSICGSTVGGIKATQEMLDFCAQSNITAEVEVIDIKSVREAFDNVKNKKVKYRYVIDLATLG